MRWNSSRTIQIPKRGCHLGFAFIISANLKTQQRPQDWKRSILIWGPKKGSTKECANHWTVTLISHAGKVKLKILHSRLQHYVNQQLPDVQVGFRKGRGARDQIGNICWIVARARKFQISIYFCFINYAEAFAWIMTNCGKLLERWAYQTILPVSWETCMWVK